MVRALAALERGALTCAPQPEEGVTYADKIAKDEARIDWRRPADELHNHIRGLSPFPGAWCEMPLGGKPERVKILHARPADGHAEPGRVIGLDPLTVACSEGALELVELQRAGKKPAPAADFLRGGRLAAGETLL
jgi:methionyl-tRNA formyltransferase